MIPPTARPITFIDNTPEILPESSHIIPDEDSSIPIILDTSPITPTTHIIPPHNTLPSLTPITHTPPQAWPADKPILVKPIFKTVDGGRTEKEIWIPERGQNYPSSEGMLQR